MEQRSKTLNGSATSSTAACRLSVTCEAGSTRVLIPGDQAVRAGRLGHTCMGARAGRERWRLAFRASKSAVQLKLLSMAAACISGLLTLGAVGLDYCRPSVSPDQTPLELWASSTAACGSGSGPW